MNEFHVLRVIAFRRVHATYRSLKLYLSELARWRSAGWFTKKLSALPLTEAILVLGFLAILVDLVVLLSVLAVIGGLERYAGGTHGIPITYSFAAFIKIVYLLILAGTAALFFLYWQNVAREKALEKNSQNTGKHRTSPGQHVVAGIYLSGYLLGRMEDSWTPDQDRK